MPKLVMDSQLQDSDSLLNCNAILQYKNARGSLRAFLYHTVSKRFNLI